MLALKHKLNVALPQPVNLLHALNEIEQQLGICVSYLFFQINSQFSPFKML